LASRQYISIIRLFHYCDIPAGGDFNLSRTKKQLLAEFAISKDGFIELDGYTYTRQDVFEQLEHPDFYKLLHYHKEIWNRPALLDFLEDNIFNPLTINDAFLNLSNDHEFISFISPYLTAPFNHISRNLLNEGKLPEVGKLLTYSEMLQASEREEAFRSLRIFLDENLRILRNVSLHNYTIMRPRLIHWINSQWHILINNLPSEFYFDRMELIVRLINVGVAIQKKHTGDCLKMSDQLVQVTDITAEMKKTITSNHKVYRGAASSGGRFYWIVAAVVVLIKVVGPEGCNGQSREPRFQDIQYNVHYLDSATGRTKDSVGELDPTVLPMVQRLTDSIEATRKY